MEVTPFIIKAEEGLSGNLEKGEIIGRMTNITPELELAISFIALEAYRRKLGPEWRYTYITKILLPHVRTLSGPGRTLFIEAYPGSQQTTLYAQKSPNLAKIGNTLKGKPSKEYPAGLKDTYKFLRDVETLKIAFRGLIDKETALRFAPFLLRSFDAGPESAVTQVVPFAALESKVDNSTAIEIAQHFNRLIEQIETSLSQHEQIRDFYRETSDNHVRQLTIQVDNGERKLSKELESVKANVVDEIRKLQNLRRDKLYVAEQDKTDNSISAVKRIVPLLTTIQNQIIELHNRLDLQRNKLMERNFDPKKTFDEIQEFETALNRGIKNLQSSSSTMPSESQEIEKILAKIDEESSLKRKYIEDEYKEDLKFQESRAEVLRQEREDEISELQSLVDSINQELQSILVTMDSTKQKILDQRHQAMELALDPELFPVKKTADTIYLPVYVAKFEKAEATAAEPESLYYFLTPGVWDPESNKQTSGLPPNFLISSMTEPLLERVKNVATKSPIFRKNLDKTSQKGNLAVNLDAEEYLLAGLSQLAKNGNIQAKTIDDLKNSWFKACRLCPHCGEEVINRKGFCNNCGNPILIRSNQT